MRDFLLCVSTSLTYTSSSTYHIFKNSVFCVSVSLMKLGAPRGQGYYILFIFVPQEPKTVFNT